MSKRSLALLLILSAGLGACVGPHAAPSPGLEATYREADRYAWAEGAPFVRGSQNASTAPAPRR